MNVELDELKIKQDKISKPDIIQIKESIKPFEPIDDENNLKERIVLFLENSKKGIKERNLKNYPNRNFYWHFSLAKDVKMGLWYKGKKYISIAEDKIVEFLDVCNYLNLIENVNKLKFILLNNFQILSFKYLKNQDPANLFDENYNGKLLETIKYFKQEIISLIAMIKYHSIISKIKAKTINFFYYKINSISHWKNLK